VRSEKYSTQVYCENIRIRDVNCDGSYRNGIGVTDVNGLAIEDCNLRNTSGHKPQAGIDLEPSYNHGKLTNIVVRNTTIHDNKTGGIDIYLNAFVSDESVPNLPDVNILLENIDIAGSERGLHISGICDSGPDGSITCRNISVEDTDYGAWIRKSSLSVDLVFEDCTWSNSSQSGECTIWTQSYWANVEYAGGIEFINCQVIDNQNLPAINFVPCGNDLYELHGDIYVDNPNRPGPLYDWSGATLSNVDVTLHSEDANTCKAHNDTNDCLYQTPHECYTSINAAIDEALSSDEITVYPATHYETVDFDGKAITVRSRDPNDPNVVAATIIDANGASKAVYFHNSETSSSVLRGFTLTGAEHGIYCNGASPVIENCVIRDNQDTGDEGAGMYNDNSSPTVTKCVFKQNTAEYGGGMFNHDESSPTVTGCVFYDNTAEDGAGMANDRDCAPTVVNCLFYDNEADYDGGGIHNDESLPTIINCTFRYNEADSGEGGALYNEDDSDANVVNCIFWYNYSPYSGDEIYNRYSSPTISYCDIKDCGGSGAGWDTDLGVDGGGNIDDDPDFEDDSDPEGDDEIWATCDDGLRIKSTSPCKDEGSNAAVPQDVDTDIKGSDRFINTTVDMGAYEYDSGC
jgi:hypothetical protein